MSKKITELNNKNNFVCIENIYRGGNQDWFNTTIKSFRHGRFGGCGSVCAANMISYLALENPKEYSELVPFKIDSISKSSFLIFMEEIYRYCRPLPNLLYYVNKRLPVVFGIPFPFMLKVGIRRYLRRIKNKKLQLKIMTNKSFSASLNFIKKSLNNNIPVGIVVWGNINMKKYEYHWMTVVGISEDSHDDRVVATVATWGELHEVCLNDLYNSPNIFRKFGMITFDTKKTLY